MVKKNVNLIFLVFFVYFISFNLVEGTANTPSNMILTYNSVEDELSVEITHNIGSDSPSVHHIKTVIISVNSSEVINQGYNTQPTSTTFTYIYNLTANNGAIIQVTAICSISGSITRSLTVGVGQNPVMEIPGYFGLWIIFIGLISWFIMLTHKKLKTEKNR